MAACRDLSGRAQLTFLECYAWPAHGIVIFSAGRRVVLWPELDRTRRKVGPALESLQPQVAVFEEGGGEHSVRRGWREGGGLA